jgi:hypothetical protein
MSEIKQQLITALTHYQFVVIDDNLPPDPSGPYSIILGYNNEVIAKIDFYIIMDEAPRNNHSTRSQDNVNQPVVIISSLDTEPNFRGLKLASLLILFVYYKIMINNSTKQPEDKIKWVLLDDMTGRADDITNIYSSFHIVSIDKISLSNIPGKIEGSSCEKRGFVNDISDVIDTLTHNIFFDFKSRFESKFAQGRGGKSRKRRKTAKKHKQTNRRKPKHKNNRSMRRRRN